MEEVAFVFAVVLAIIASFVMGVGAGIWCYRNAENQLRHLRLLKRKQNKWK